MATRAWSRLRVAGAIGAIVALLAASACSASPSSRSKSSAPGPDVAKIDRTKCAACHVAPEPGVRARASVEEAAQRHRTRLRLSQEEWAAMIDYLAAPERPHANRDGAAAH